MRVDVTYARFAHAIWISPAKSENYLNKEMVEEMWWDGSALWYRNKKGALRLTPAANIVDIEPVEQAPREDKPAKPTKRVELT